MMDITVPVPPTRVAEFYQLVAQFLEAEPTPPAGISEPAASPVDPAGPDKVDWGEDPDTDHADAVELWRRFSSGPKSIFTLLLDNPETRYTGDEIARELGMSSAHVVAGTLGNPGRIAAQRNRHLPIAWHRHPESGISEYWARRGTAEIFRAARDEVDGA